MSKTGKFQLTPLVYMTISLLMLVEYNFTKFSNRSVLLKILNKMGNIKKIVTLKL